MIGKKLNHLLLLRLDDDDDGAAQVDVNECTGKPESYDHPTNQNVKFWDLPGIGSPQYPGLETYVQKVQLDICHIFLIMANNRLNLVDVILANELKKQGKSFLFVRTKIDQDIRAEMRKRSFSEAAVLQKIRRDCIENLVDKAGKPIGSEDDIFLISNHDPDKWDFSRLTEAILDVLPRRQREALTLSLSNLTSLSKSILKRKVDVLKGRIILVAGLSAVVAAVPIPELAIAIDAALIFNEVKEYINQLGIPEERSEMFKALSFSTQKTIVTAQDRFSSVGKILALFAKEASVGLAVEEGTRYISFVGSAIAGTLSFGCSIVFLRNCLKEIEKVALAVLEEANQRSVDSLDRE